jgi:hypothetical protein
MKKFATVSWNDIGVQDIELTDFALSLFSADEAREKALFARKGGSFLRDYRAFAEEFNSSEDLLWDGERCILSQE